jgi:hypothetical protein
MHVRLVWVEAVVGIVGIGKRSGRRGRRGILTACNSRCGGLLSGFFLLRVGRVCQEMWSDAFDVVLVLERRHVRRYIIPKGVNSGRSTTVGTGISPANLIPHDTMENISLDLGNSPPW